MLGPLPVLRDIVLVGGGHSHVGVLRSFGMAPMPGVRLTLICRDSYTPYSGMLPGYIAGHYGYDDVHIDLRRLAAFAGARMLGCEAIGLDLDRRQILCRGRPAVAYDLLSINVGSTPDLTHVPGAAELALPVKPIHMFNQRWLALLARVKDGAGPLQVAVVGAGAGGVELLLAMRRRLRHELRTAARDPDALQFHLIDGAERILPTHNPRVQNWFMQELTRRGVRLHLGQKVHSMAPGSLTLVDGTRVSADEVIWVTQASGAGWLGDTGLALDAQGFIRVNEHLQSVSDARVFAAGDIASLEGQPLEKAGVFAVRQGVPLAENLRRAVRGQPLRGWRAQRRWLALIGTGERHAVASRGWFSAQGEWVWRWKDWIDRRFMQRFNQLPSMPMQQALRPVALPLMRQEAEQAQAAAAMRCGGCGAKVGAPVLARALRGLQPMQHADVLLGLAAPDDAAVLRVPPGMVMVHSVDFFRSFIDDPWTFGRIAANHALGDLFAMGAMPQSASAIVTLPPGLEAKVEDQLRQMMAGAVDMLNAAGCALVGGHSSEGTEVALGFAVNGLIDENLAALTRKSGLHAGDVLVLTKPLGTGIVLAAHARAQAQGRWVDTALESMLRSGRQAARCLHTFGASACTDVTGFGLLGHLVEMAQPSGVDVELDLAALPALPGACELAARGVSSSLHAANLERRSLLRATEEAAAHPCYPLLFDPQTAGGLLAGLPPEQAEACVAALRASGEAQACVIGRVLARSGPESVVALRAGHP